MTDLTVSPRLGILMRRVKALEVVRRIYGVAPMASEPGEAALAITTAIADTTTTAIADTTTLDINPGSQRVIDALEAIGEVACRIRLIVALERWLGYDKCEMSLVADAALCHMVYLATCQEPPSDS